jgi:two-component sensor histidine kinase
LSLREDNVALESRVAERTRELENERMRIEALLNDVNHRVGNNLVMVSALLNVQSRQSKEPVVKEALSQAQSRVQAIAAGQRRLRLDLDTDEIDVRQYMEDLLGEIGKNIETRPITLHLDVGTARLPGRDAVSYVVIVNELVMNAVKHAFPGDTAGNISVRLLPSAEPGMTSMLVVEDDGGGMPADLASDGLGRTIIDSLVRSMRASMRVGPVAADTARPGTRISIHFPGKLDGAGAQRSTW